VGIGAEARDHLIAGSDEADEPDRQRINRRFMALFDEDERPETSLGLIPLEEVDALF